MVNELILVVDDGKDNRDFLVEYVLQPNEFRYITARDGQEGFGLARDQQPDLILLDLQMPRMDGIQVLEQLQAHNLNIPVILMTFHGSEEIAVEVYRMGVRDYIKKPYYPEEMVEAIEHALTESRLRAEKEALTKRILKANQDLQQRVRELNTLYNVGKSVTSMTEMQTLMPHIVESAVTLTHAEEGMLCLMVENRLICRAHRDQSMKGARNADFEVSDPIAAHVMRNHKPVVLGAEQLKNQGSNMPNSVVYIPLMIEDRMLGLLTVSNFTPNSAEFKATDGKLLSALADYAAIAIENSANYGRLQDQKRQVQDTFERFVAPSVVHEALSKPDGISLGGTRKEVSVLFADIRGYTAWSEHVTPEQVVETLNHYLSLAAGVVMGWEGTLDKFFGDGLMAIFNAPNDQHDHVHRAAETAIAMMKAAREVNLQHGYKLQYSIGVHVGEAVVGYIGSSDALNYTAIGDTVNLTKRLQESAQPGQILIEEEVVRRLGNAVKANRLGELPIKGRQAPAIAYELIDVR